MRITVFLLVLLVSSLRSFAQVTILGKTALNGVPVNACQLEVYSEGKMTVAHSTGTSSEFMLKLDFGKIHQVYIRHQNAPLMFFEVVANTVPADKYVYRLTYELFIDMPNHMDEDVDTTVFQQAFHRVIFNGSKQMVADTAYNHQFAQRILVKNNPELRMQREKNHSILAGRFGADEQAHLLLYPASVAFYDQDNVLQRSLQTDRFGTFAFRSRRSDKFSKVKLTWKDSSLHAAQLSLKNTKGETIKSTTMQQQTAIWELNAEQAARLCDNSYQAHIGGKIVTASSREKRFFSERCVYLLNKHFMVIDKTQSNMIGSFVFSDIQPDQTYYLAIDRNEIWPGEKGDILNKNDQFVSHFDSIHGDKYVFKVSSRYPVSYNKLLVAENELQMDVKATIFGDNVNNPIGNLKIILLNDMYEPIDSVVTDDFGSFKFKYLPFLKRFYLDADNSDNILDVFRNILIYSNDDRLIKIMTHQKGKKFSYRPLSTEIVRMREVEIEDPWMKLMQEKPMPSVSIDSAGSRLIVENIHFEKNNIQLNQQAREILDKIILVLSTQKHLRIEIGAHTDNVGSEAENLKLSQQRAKAVHTYILAAGIESNRLISKGYGETKPLIPCSEKKPCSESDHAINRRIEFKIISNLNSK